MRSASYFMAAHVGKLKVNAQDRLAALLAALNGTPVNIRGKDCLKLDGSRIRIAVDDFTTILKEIRRLK